MPRHGMAHLRPSFVFIAVGLITTIFIVYPLISIAGHCTFANTKYSRQSQMNDNLLADPNDVQLTRLYINIFYVWCGKRTFECKHYLSIMSVLRFRRSDNVVLYYDIHPRRETYNTWLDDIFNEFPFLVVRVLQANAIVCTGILKPDRTFIEGLLSLRENMPVNERIILTDYKTEFPLSVVDENGQILIATSKAVSSGSFSTVKSTGRERYCLSVSQLVESSGKMASVITDEKKLFLRDIMVRRRRFRTPRPDGVLRIIGNSSASLQRQRSDHKHRAHDLVW